MSDGAKGLTRQQMCDRLAMEFQDGWVVNLGIGIPTLCSNFDFGDKEIIFHSENGVMGYGPLAAPQNNADPKPFTWTKSAHDIVLKVSRGRAALGKPSLLPNS